MAHETSPSSGIHLLVMNSNYFEAIKKMTTGECVYHAVDDVGFPSWNEAANQ